MPRKQLRLYKVYNDRGMMFGNFFYYPDEQAFNFNDTEIFIKINSKLFKAPQYLLIDRKDRKQIGHFQINQFRTHTFWKYNPSPIGRIHLGDEVYNFKRVSPDIQPSPFKQETWGHFKFSLCSSKSNENIEYSLKMDIPVLSKANFTKYRPFEGFIESNTDNMFAILSGIYLIELAFQDEDNKDDG